MVHAFNLSTWKAETGGSGQPGLHGKLLASWGLQGNPVSKTPKNFKSYTCSFNNIFNNYIEAHFTPYTLVDIQMF